MFVGGDHISVPGCSLTLSAVVKFDANSTPTPAAASLPVSVLVISVKVPAAFNAVLGDVSFIRTQTVLLHPLNLSVNGAFGQ